MRPRVKRSLFAGAALLLCGLGYAGFYRLTGWGLPCPIHSLTGLYCPSCGVSRMCLHLLQGEWAEAFRSNPALFLLLPVFAGLFGWIELRYWRTGCRRLTKAQSAAAWGLVAVLVLFGILRNLPSFAALRPAG
ncbi:MAG: DUF2752 domain-containing protein [Provencibacterium sp.]|jgi:hypothetical protein|nr:DUF2752 domain-containing protein [Provencibacterium sp.]